MAAEELTTYQVEVLVEVKMAGDENAAYTAVDEIMQRAWDTDDGRKWVQPKWHFEMLEGCVNVIGGAGAGAEGAEPSDATRQLAQALRDVVGESCESHAEFEPGCPTCVALSLLTVRGVH
jgi:diaminopimelate decarboxylase